MAVQIIKANPTLENVSFIMVKIKIGMFIVGISGVNMFANSLLNRS